MRFLITRASQGAVSGKPPCRGAVQGPEAAAWPGEYQWFVDIDRLDQLMTFLNDQGGALGLFTPEEGESYPSIEIFDDTEDEE